METTCEEFLQVTDHNRVSASSEINIQPELRWPTQNVIEAFLSKELLVLSRTLISNKWVVLKEQE